MQEFLENLDWDDQLKNEFASMFSPVFYQPKELLLEAGDVCDFVHFILDGHVREFDQETYWLLGKNHWILAIESYVTGEASSTSIEAIDSVTALKVVKSDILAFLEKEPSFYKDYVGILEYYLVMLERRDRLHRKKSATERLEHFEELFPEIQNKLKQKDIASFLGITPQQLSRVRRERREK